jgi:hypothetical protein
VALKKADWFYCNRGVLASCTCPRVEENCQTKPTLWKEGGKGGELAQLQLLNIKKLNHILTIHMTIQADSYPLLFKIQK